MQSRHLWGLAAALSALAISPAQASDDEIIALSTQADQAFDEGRYEDADAAAEAAWRQAEAEWGAVEDTAFLADNLARARVATGQRAAAREPAARVLDLAERGLTPSISTAEARLLAAAAGFDPAAPDGAARTTLESALRSAADGGVPPSPLVWTGWLDVGRDYFNAGGWYLAQQAGQAAMRTIGVLGDAPADSRAEVALIAGISAAQLEEYEEGAVAFQWATASIPPAVANPDGTTTANPSWAMLQAWSSAMDAAYATVEQRAQTDGSALSDLPIPPLPGVGQRCSPVWLERRPGTYPMSEMPRTNTRLSSSAMMIGAVVIGFRIAADGTTEQVETLAAVPESIEGFSRAAMNAVKDWRADPDTLEGCAGQAQMVTTQYRVIYPR